MTTHGKQRKCSDTGSERSCRVFRGDRLQVITNTTDVVPKVLRVDHRKVHLLGIEEQFRSKVLYEQLTAFEDKVRASLEGFSVELFNRMFIAITKRTVVDVRKVKTLGHLRKCFTDLRKATRCKLRRRNIQRTKEEEMLLRYFTWYFSFVDYLRELRDNFVARIYTTLFRYFYHTGYDSPYREDSVASAISGKSLMSFRSIDSGYGELNQVTQNVDIDHVMLSARSTEEDETPAARRSEVTRQALLYLGKQFNDIKQLYDNTEIEQLAMRLCHLKERTDHMLNNEDSLGKDLFCQDSESFVFDLKIQNIGPQNIARFVPDVLIKLQKAVWLSRRWLEKDDVKTKDLNAKLDKLTALENSMNNRLRSLEKEISQQEEELQLSSNSLQSLLLREERSNDISQLIFDLKEKSHNLKEQLKNLNIERNDLCQKLTKAFNENDRSAYKQLRPLYQRNKLKRFALERQIATVNFHLHLEEEDMGIEMKVKPTLIHGTNDTQDKCEEIEQNIEKARKEQSAINIAIDPVRKDIHTVQEQLNRKPKIRSSTPKIQAKFVDSHQCSNDHSVDLNAEFMGIAKIGDPFSIFMTSVPDDTRSTSVYTPIKPVNTSGTHIPELLSSEW